MDSLERLYRAGFISYPRTETTIFHPSIDLSQIVATLCTDESFGFGPFAMSLAGKNLVPRKGNSDDKSHPPIHPVKLCSESQLSDETDKVVYKFVCCHFLACVAHNAKVERQRITLKAGEHTFSHSSSRITDKQFLEVYEYQTHQESEGLKGLLAGEKVEKFQFKKSKGETSPPTPMTEAELISLMEKHGIGTDATIHSHIQTI